MINQPAHNTAGLPLCWRDGLTMGIWVLSVCKSPKNRTDVSVGSQCFKRGQILGYISFLGTFKTS
jgi:hypothetical protein